MDKHTVMTVLLDKRTDAAPEVQEILTAFGSIISSRIGLHQAGNSNEDGLIILHLNGRHEEINKLQQKLEQIHRVKVKKMQVSFDE